MPSTSNNVPWDFVLPPRRRTAWLSVALIAVMALLSGVAFWQAQDKASALAEPEQSFDVWFLSSLQSEMERLHRAAIGHDDPNLEIHLDILDGMLNSSPHAPQTTTRLLPQLPDAQDLLEQLRANLKRWQRQDPAERQAELQDKAVSHLDALHALAVEAHITLTNQRDAARIDLHRRFEVLSAVFGLFMVACLWLLMRLYLAFRYAAGLNTQLSDLNRQLDARVQCKTHQLAEGHALLTFILDSSPSEIALVSAADCRVVLLNQRLLKRLQWNDSPEHLPLHQLLLQPEDRVWFNTELAARGCIDAWQTQIAAPKPYWVSLSVQRVQVQGESAYLLWMNDISEHKRLEANLRDLAATDALTGIANRRALFERGEWMLKNCLRHGHPCSLLMLDIDRFKRINDTYGHDVGDNAIRSVVRTLGQHMRDTDLCGRLGGEEFAMILPLTPMHLATEVAERLRQAISETPFDAGAAGEKFLTVSIGVVCSALQIDTLTQLLHEADRALYTAKTGGRNRVCTPPLSSVQSTDEVTAAEPVMQAPVLRQVGS